jgi:hypothetical protein
MLALRRVLRHLIFRPASAHQAIRSMAAIRHSSSSTVSLSVPCERPQAMRAAAQIHRPDTIFALMVSNSESLISLASSISRAWRRRRAGSDSAPAASPLYAG